MRTSPLQLVLPVIFLVFSSSCTMMDLDAPTDESEVFKQPEPEFPHSELEKRREGWVLVTYSVSRGGLVDNIYVEESSGNRNFEEAALNGVREWRYAPGEQRELNVLINFVDGQDEAPLSQKFYDLNRQAHELIDEGKLERAHELLTEARDDEDLHPSELAYSILTETHSGRRRAADLEEIVQAATARIDADPAVMQPYVVADSSVTVLGSPLPDRFSTLDRQPEPGSGRHGMYNPSKSSPRGGSERD